MTMMLRRAMMRKTLAASGWQSVVYTAAGDTLKGNTTIPALRAILPVSYRYAVALADDTENLENGKFLGAVFLPDRSEVHGLRYYNDVLGQNNNIGTGSSSLIVRAGATVTVWWRTEPIASDSPTTGWGYSCIQPGPISRANGLKAALQDIGDWTGIIAVADIDNTTLPETDNTWCESIVTQNPGSSWAGTSIRVVGGEYKTVSQWTNAYELIIDSGTKVACFYI